MISSPQVLTLLQALAQIRIFHWSTTSYAEHVALGELYDSLDEHIDAFVETASGRAKAHIEIVRAPIVLEPYEQVISVSAFLVELQEFLVDELPKATEAGDTDLLNIRDEMLGAVNRTLYKLSLA